MSESTTTFSTSADAESSEDDASESRAEGSRERPEKDVAGNDVHASPVDDSTAGEGESESARAADPDDVPDPDDDAPSARTVDEICPHCGAERVGIHCHVCGQKYRDAPLTLREFWQHSVETLFDVEQGLLYTVRLAIVNPGTVSRRYLDGESKRFVSPMGYFLLCVTFVFGIYWILEDAFVRQLVEFIEVSGSNALGTAVKDAEMNAIKTLGFDSLDAYAAWVYELQTQYLTALTLVNALPAAVGLRMFFSERTFAETLVHQLYVTAQHAVYNVILVIVALFSGSFVVLGLSLPIQVGIQAWSATGLYGRSWRTAVLGGLGAFLGSVIFAILVVGLFIAVLAFTDLSFQ